MPRLSLWNSGQKSSDYRFIDRTISEFFGVGGTAVYVHLYLGPHDQTGSTNPDEADPVLNTTPLGGTAPSTTINQSSVEDVLFLENRDRKYSPTIYELRGIYNVADVDFDLRQFGLFLQGDTLFIEFHLNDMVAACGRRLIPGDVIELPHQRDDTIPGAKAAMNKYYVVQDANRASDGYSATWWPHIWRLKVTPMTASQEFEDILDQNATNPLGFVQGKVGDLFTTLTNELAINEEIVQDAIAQVPARFFETRQYWFVPGDHPADTENPWLFAGGGDAIPPDGAVPVATGTTFPTAPAQGDYCLRTDYSPAALFEWVGDRWVLQEVNWRGTAWNVAGRLLETFINNDNTTTLDDGTVVPQKQNLSQTIKPRADF